MLGIAIRVQQVIGGAQKMETQIEARKETQKEAQQFLEASKQTTQNLILQADSPLQNGPRADEYEASRKLAR